MFYPTEHFIRKLSVALLTLSLLIMTNVVSAATFTGNIASGAQFDLYTLDLLEGERITATLVCDEIAPGDRPLDPVLSVFFPGSDSSDLDNANVYNDDGFGSDDDPNGVDCNAFDSSRIRFTVPETGTYTFRADGFGSSTGPYTLNIRVRSADSEPEETWFEPGDDRINRQAYAQASIYCDGENSRVLILGIDSKGQGQELINVPYANLPPVPTDSNVLIQQSGNVAFYRLTSGEYQVNAGPDFEGKTYVVIWDNCPHTRLNAYNLQNGVLTQTETNPHD